MNLKLLITLTLSLLTLIAFCGGTNARVFSAERHDLDQCSEIAPSIRNLRSPNKRKLKTAKKAILLFSSRSLSSRQCVITAMMRIFVTTMANPYRGFTLAAKYPQRYAQWAEATDILGTLKATEAMDSLIDNLDYNYGAVSDGIGHFPAAIAIVKFGDQAIPKLEEALRRKPPHLRSLAVYALRAIGGEKARQVVENALETEKDESVAVEMRNLLLTRNWKTTEKY